MPSTLTHTDLSLALDEELKCVGQFSELLAAERDALCGGDLDQVSSFAQDKLVLAQRLQLLATQRETLRKAQRQNDVAGHDPFNRKPLDLQWRTLTAALDRAAETNRINGLIVSSRLAYVSNAINALHGAAGATPLYQNDGSARPVQSSSGMARWSA